MVANSGKLSTMSTTSSNTLTDKVDSPHSGLFTAIHSMTQGNYALKDHASTLGFAHTFAGGGSPTVAVTAGKAFFDGKYVTVTALTASALDKPPSGAFYHWIVAQDDGDGTYSCAIVMGGIDGVIPDLNTTSVTVEKVPISLIKVQSTDTASTVAVQYFTTSKEQNSLSIGYSATNVYAETSSITGTASGLFISGIGTATVAGADKVLIQDAGSSDVIKTVTASSIASVLGTPAVLTGTTNNTITTVTAANAIQGEANLLFDGSTLAVTGALTTTTTATVGTDLTVTGGDITYGNAQNATLGITATAHDTAGKPLSISSGPTTAGTTNNITGGSLTFKGGQGKGSGAGGDIIFQTANAGGSGSSLNALATALTISGVGDFSTFDGLVGIGTSSSTPSAPLHIIYTGAAEGLIIESTDGGSANAPDLILFRNSGSPADDDELGVINFRGDDGAGNSTDYAFIAARTTEVDNGSEEGALKFGIFDAGS